MACSYCDSPTDYCDCEASTRQHHHHRPRVYHQRYSNPIWEPESPKTSSCRVTYDYHIPRSRSRRRRNHHAQPSFCDFCQQEYCRCRYPSSEHNAALSVHCSYCGYEPCECSSVKLRSIHDVHKPTKGTEQTLRIQLFEAKKKDKKYEEATKVFQDAMACDKSRRTSDEMLKLMVSFADMQVSQGNSGEAEKNIDDVLRWKDLPHGLEKQCYAIRGKILCARKRYNEAESLYRKLYDRASKDEWSLDMGDEMCNVIASQGDYDLARLEQTNLLEKRKKNLGAAHPATVQTATVTAENIRKLIQKLPKDDGPARDRSQKRKQALIAEIEYLLRDIWMSIAGTSQKQEANMLKVGHELGCSLSSQDKWAEAEKVLSEVWQVRRDKLGDFNKDTMTSGISLGEVMYRQVLPLGEAMYQSPKCRTARSIFEPIGLSGVAQTYGVDESIAAAARAHLGVVYTFMKAYDIAERLLQSFGWSTNNTSAMVAVTMPPPDLVHHALTKCLEARGGAKRTGSQQLQLDTGRYGRTHQPIVQNTLMRDRLIASAPSPWTSTSSPWTGTASGRLTIAPDAFNAQSEVLPMTCRSGVEWYTTASFNGQRCMESKDLESAKTVLGQAWNQEANGLEEAALRARCGDQYGLCLTKLRQYEKARRVLKDVKALKKRLYPGPPNQERLETGIIRKKIPNIGRDGRKLYGDNSRRNEPPSLIRMMLT